MNVQIWIFQKIMCDKQISKGVIYFDDFFLWWKLKNQIAYETREHFDRPQIVLIWKKRKTVKFYFTVCIFFIQSQQMECLCICYFFPQNNHRKIFVLKPEKKHFHFICAACVFFRNWWKFEMCFCLLLSFMTVNSVILFLEFNRLVEHWCVNRRIIGEQNTRNVCCNTNSSWRKNEEDVLMKKKTKAHIFP